jgi:hypothetical protein
VDITSGATRVLGFSAGVYDSAGAWKRQGHLLAVSAKDGTYVVDAATGTARRLTTDQADAGAAWAPDGSYLAYTTSTDVGGDYAITDLHAVTLAGETRTLVNGAGAYGGDLWNLAWTRGPSGSHYRLPQPRVLAAISGDGLTAWPVTRLAADGDRVAYISCDHVFVWRPTAQTVVQAEPSSSLNPLCASPSFSANFAFYTLGLSGDRIAYAFVFGGSGKSCGLECERIGDPASFFGNTTFGGFCGYDRCDQGFGDLTGGGGLLVFSTWDKTSTCPGAPREQEIRRLDYRGDTGWSNALIAKTPGPLVPFDVDAGRIVAGGNNATVLYDASGTQLLSVPVSPLAAQLSGSDLVILVRGQLLVYDAVTGARLHAWPVPDVPSGAECGSIYSGTWECRGTELILEDAAHGLAAYVVDGQVHVIQLQNGTDMTIGKGSIARFVDAGLVYADGARIQLIPFDQLPLR